mmetsp:Transcript_24445/g.65302  ORF Transcript_24445/g.65302 Transcript_24445/m.65302 type:complete len:119 (+) Transcript_24445:41-397(+)
MRSHGKSSSGSWWKTYVSDTRNYDVVWDIRDQDPRLKIINGAVYADDLERANWRKQVVFSRNRAQEAIRKVSSKLTNGYRGSVFIMYFVNDSIFASTMFYIDVCCPRCFYVVSIHFVY